MTFLKKHYFTIILIVFFILAATATVFRFFVQTDFMVTYEIDCNPTVQNCFEGGEDEDRYPYAYMTRQANIVEGQCGVDITDCNQAQFCQPGEEACSIEYCSDDCYEEAIIDSNSS